MKNIAEFESLRLTLFKLKNKLSAVCDFLIGQIVFFNFRSVNLNGFDIEKIERILVASYFKRI